MVYVFQEKEKTYKYKGLVYSIKFDGDNPYLLSDCAELNGCGISSSLKSGYKYSWIGRKRRLNGRYVVMFDVKDITVLNSRGHNGSEYDVLEGMRTKCIERAKNAYVPVRSIMVCPVTGRHFMRSKGVHLFGELRHPNIDYGRCAITSQVVAVGYNGIVTDSGEYVVNEKITSYVKTCADCGASYIYNNGEVSTNIDGDPICCACATKYFVCRACNEVHRKSNESEYADICNSCSTSFARCATCGGIYRISDMYDGICSSCVGNPIKNYSSKFNNLPDYGNARMFGVEIELECKSDTDKKRAAIQIQKAIKSAIMIKSDGSLDDGFEVVTRPFSIEESLEVCSNVLSAAVRNGMTAKSTCGVHIHVSRDSISNETLAKMLLIFSELEDDVEKIARRDCREWAKISKKRKADFNTNSFINDETESRYKAINIQNSATIEFRIFKGTVKKQNIIGYLLFVDAFIKGTERISLEEINSNITFGELLKHELQEPKYVALSEYLKSVDVI